VREKIAEFIEQGIVFSDEARKKPSYTTIQGRLTAGYVAHGIEYERWKNDIKLYLSRNLSNHPLCKEIIKLIDIPHKGFSNIQVVDGITGKLQSIVSDDEFFESPRVQPLPQAEELMTTNHIPNKKIFIVHGHDDGAKEEVARFVEKIGLKAIILHEKTDNGQTIIEKFEKHSDVGYAIILYTPCDEGKAKEEEIYSKRARQNVIFEHGFFVAKLGREKVCALIKDGTEQPSDLSGILFKAMKGTWKYDVIGELKAAGYNVDANKILNERT